MMEDKTNPKNPNPGEAPLKNTTAETELSSVKEVGAAGGPGSSPAQTGGSGPPRGPSFLQRFSPFHNVYLLVLVLLLLTTAGVIIAAIKFNNANSGQPSKAQSLTDEQLAELKGSTTIVGD